MAAFYHTKSKSTSPTKRRAQHKNKLPKFPETTIDSTVRDFFPFDIKDRTPSVLISERIEKHGVWRNNYQVTRKKQVECGKAEEFNTVLSGPCETALSDVGDSVKHSKAKTENDRHSGNISQSRAKSKYKNLLLYKKSNIFNEPYYEKYTRASVSHPRPRKTCHVTNANQVNSHSATPHEFQWSYDSDQGSWIQGAVIQQSTWVQPQPISFVLKNIIFKKNGKEGEENKESTISLVSQSSPLKLSPKMKRTPLKSQKSQNSKEPAAAEEAKPNVSKVTISSNTLPVPDKLKNKTRNSHSAVSANQLVLDEKRCTKFRITLKELSYASDRIYRIHNLKASRNPRDSIWIPSKAIVSEGAEKQTSRGVEFDMFELKNQSQCIL